jgi:tetratricopeptide (TPR) repeat protein
MHAEYAECLAYNFQYEEALKEGNEAIRLSHKKLAVEASLFCTEQAELLHDRLRLWQEICRRSMSVKLSACVIVKNEAGEIRRWLENVKAYCDEIILVDTGSTDATRQIAESAGAQIFEFAWNGDFSAARNFMIAKASGDWIISPDADEYFIQPEKIRFFMAEVDVMQPKVDAVMVTSSNIDADYGNQEINRYPVVRIFRRRQELRYVGNIHECLWRPDGELNVFMEKSRILLLHTGYSTGRIMKKTHRDLAMLLQDIQKNGEGEQHYAYLASCYFGLQEYEKSLHYAQLAIQAKIQGVGVTSELYHETIISLIHLHRPLAEQLAMARRGVQRFPLLPDFYAYEGDMLCALRRIPEGEQALERARDLFEHPRDSSGEATMARNIMGSVYSRLGKIYQRNGRMQESKEACRQALQLRPYQTDFLLEYIEMQQDQTPEALAAALSEIYSNTPLHQEYLRRWAEQYGFVQLSRCYAAQLPTASELWKKVEQGYGLAQQQRFEELKDSVLQRVGQVLPLFFLGLLDLAALPQGTGNLLLEHSRSLLPKGLQRVLERYTCDDKELSAAEFDSYVSMLEVVANSGTPLQVHRYLQIALDFSWADVYRIAQQLLRGEHWQEAMTLYAAIPEDVSVVTAMFWQEVGICFFQLHQLEAAEESLRRAQQMGAANKEIEAYLCWIGKAASHD